MTEGISREEVLKANPFLKYLESKAVKMKKGMANQCGKRKHSEDHFCVSIDAEKEIWNCHSCDVGGSIIDWMACEKGVSPKEVYRELAINLGKEKEKSNTPKSSAKPVIVKTYDYTDEQGNLIYQVCRYEPKDFRQRQPDDKGGWKWTMEGVTRVLYRLPDVLKSKVVVIAEGEKDCDTLVEMGWVATTNVGGAENWLDAYADSLSGKDIIIVPDNDTKGIAHSKLIATSLEEKANSIKVVPMPKPYKDTTEFVTAQPDRVKAAESIRILFDKATHAIAPLPLYTIEEMEGMYSAFQQRYDANSLSLGKFLPSFKTMRPFFPGEVIVVIASTGVGKTVIAQRIAVIAAPMPTLFFELELPTELMFERFAQMQNDCDGYEVESYYKGRNKLIADKFDELKHILLCPESGLTPDRMEKFIERSALKFGKRPAVVLVDYLGLVRGKGISRYESVSNAAESLRIIAKRTNTVMISTVQISRPEKRNEGIEVGLYDAKDSGSIENSASLALGAWRPDKDTKGFSGAIIECDFRGATMNITERPKVHKNDLPKQATLLT